MWGRKCWYLSSFACEKKLSAVVDQGTGSCPIIQQNGEVLQGNFYFFRYLLLNCLVFFRKLCFLRFGDRHTDEQMDSPDALSRSRFRERRFSSVADIKIHVIPSSKIGFVTAITITVILSCWLLGKSSCLATVAKIFTFWNGSVTENVKHIIVDIYAKFHAFITIWAIFSPVGLDHYSSSVNCNYGRILYRFQDKAR